MTDPDVTQKYRHLWVQCENCYGLNYKKFFKSKMNLCEQCGYRSEGFVHTISKVWKTTTDPDKVTTV